MNDGFGHWFAGFVDGEGCFTIPEHKHNGCLYCRLRIQLRVDDRPLLEYIQEQTGLGVVRTLGRRYGTSQLQAYWAVSRKADCLALVDLLDAYPLRSKKRYDYEVWREAVLLWNTSRQGVTFDWSGLRILADQIRTVRVFHETPV